MFIYNREIELVIDYMINQLLIIREYNHWFLSTNKYKITYKSNKLQQLIHVVRVV